MWKRTKDRNLELLSELGVIELNTLTKTYVLKKYIGKCNMPTLSADQFISIFGANVNLKAGNLIAYIKKEDLEANVSLEYLVNFTNESLISLKFCKLYSDIKEDLTYLEAVNKNYLVYLNELASHMKNKNIDKYNAAINSLKNLNIKEDNNEN